MTPEKRRKPWTVIGKALLTAALVGILSCGWVFMMVSLGYANDTPGPALSILIPSYAVALLGTAVGVTLLALGLRALWNRPRFGLTAVRRLTGLAVIESITALILFFTFVA